MKSFILGLAAVTALAACSPPIPSTKMPELPHHDVEAEKARLEGSGIATAKYRLRSDLSFADADIEKKTEMKDTKWQHEVVYHRIHIVNQKRVSQDDAFKADSHCSLVVDAGAEVQPSEINFEGKQQLLTGLMSQYSDDLIGTFFTLQLQGGAFRSFMLTCSDVLDLEQLRAHVGHILEITPSTEKAL